MVLRQRYPCHPRLRHSYRNNDGSQARPQGPEVLPRQRLRRPERDQVPGWSLRRREVHPDRRRYQRDFGDDNHDDPEPDQIKALRCDDRREKRHEDQDDGKRVHHTSQHQKDHEDGKDKAISG